MKLTKAVFNNHKWKFSPISTVLFLLLAAAILYGCVRLVLTIAKNSLSQQEEPILQAVASPVPTPSILPNAQDVAAMRTPAASISPIPATIVTPSPSVAPASTVPTLTPEATMPPVREALALNNARADLLLIGLDDDAHPDWIAIVQIREQSCRVLSIPRNTLANQTRSLMRTGSAKTCATLLTDIWPIRYPFTVALQTAGLPVFIDQFNGITCNGIAFNGAEASQFLNNGPSDELLRIERQQMLLRAYLVKLQSVSILSLLSSRFVFAPYIDSNLQASELMTLLTLLRGLDLTNLSFHTLPVDSTAIDGVRFYLPDNALITQMVPDWLD